MDAAGAVGGEAFINYAVEIAEFLNSLLLGGPLAKARIDFIVSHLISLLPPPSVPAPDDDGSSDSDDDHFSLSSSSSSDGGADLPAVVMAPPVDGLDHIGRLPDDLLSNIVSRLPTNEAARTMVLSTRWRLVWAATPLLVDDAHLRATNESREMSAVRAVRAVSRCVAAHPGPVRAARITRTSFGEQEYALQRLVASLAAKNVQDLILFNRPVPFAMPLPGDILSCASLTRLYLGIWRWPFPDTTAHPPAFPNLHELGLFHTIIEDKEVDALLAQCPKLKILSYAMACNFPSHLRVKSCSLRVVVEWRCSFDDVIIDHAPCLERLLFDSTGDLPIKIVHAPRLEVLGFLDLQFHTLEIGGIAIRAGMDVRACAMLPSVKILAVKVRFWNDTEAKMLPTLLRCFPRLEKLHIMSIWSKSPDVGDDMDFWESLTSCSCLESHLKTFVVHRFQGWKHEAAFIRYIFKNCKVLESHGIVYGDSDDVVVKGSDGSSSSDDVVVEEGPMSGSVGEGNAPSGGSSASDVGEVEKRPMSGTVGQSNAPSGGSSGKYVCAHPAFPCWSFQKAIDLSVEDPFYVLGPVIALINVVDSSVDDETAC
ncbi:hypothetical protein QYE76_020265 [Lolium multiflorum]|uniref:F-box domain-containing protein n=1 Tax=Lolium multiflorum TaxID=4521 RepID=A0AAD8VS12_LOLMU|nr:hypothetical protein QYE76_020265 [Lolium multiflorum]